MTAIRVPSLKQTKLYLTKLHFGFDHYKFEINNLLGTLNV